MSSWTDRHELRENRWRDMRRARRGSPRFLAVPVAIVQIVGANLTAGRTGTSIDAWGYALLLAGPVALLARRRAPLAVLATVLAVTVAYVALDYPLGPVFLAPLVAAVGAVRRARPGPVWALSVLAYAVFVVTTPEATIGQHVAGAVAVLGILGLATIVRVQGRQFAELNRARAEAARAKEEQSRRQASDERLRIARELHDVLGHHLSLINVRAGIALHLLDSEPDQARDALGAIKLASAEALREVRGVLSALQQEDSGAPRAPAPRLDDVDRLVEEARSAGLRVNIRRDGPVRDVPAGVDRAAYRIVQEALTNVRRHAGDGVTATIHIGYTPTALVLEITDDGVGPRPSTEDGTGNGIPGMRERAVALGGTLLAGAGTGAGFRILATLPLPEAEPDGAGPSPEEAP